MESSEFLPARRNQRSAFSLVEVTLALGLVAFCLVGILGILPIALSAGRQSVDEGRSAAIANTIFTAMRDGSWSSVARPAFTNVCYLDQHYDKDTGEPVPAASGTLDLATLGASQKTTPSAVCYAKFLAGPTDAAVADDSLGGQRRFCLMSAPPVSGADYVVSLFFDNKPDGMITQGQANRVQILVSPVPRPKDQYRFVSTIGYRSN